MAFFSHRTVPIEQTNFWLGLLAWAIFFTYLFSIPFIAKSGGDFVHLWIGGHAVATDNLANLYDPAFHKAILLEYGFSLDSHWGERYETLGAFFYPPYTALLYSPLGFLSPIVAKSVHAGLTLGLGCLSAWFLTRLLQNRLSYSAVFILLFTFPPLLYCYVLGQNSVLTMTLVLAGCYALMQQQPLRAGAVWGMLCFKPNWLLAISWIPLAMKQHRMLVGLVSSFCAVLLVTGIFLGKESIQSYLSLSPQLARLHELPNYQLESQYSILSVARRGFSPGPVSEIVGWSAALTIVLVTLLVILLSHRKGIMLSLWELRRMRVLALVLIAAVCINPHLFHYDLLLANIAGIIALAEWSMLNRIERTLLAVLLLIHHAASAVTAVLEISVPLPTLGVLGIWLWLLVRVWTLHDPPKEPVKQSGGAQV